MGEQEIMQFFFFFRGPITVEISLKFISGSLLVSFSPKKQRNKVLYSLYSGAY
jgi:hypothetical protein